MTPAHALLAARPGLGLDDLALVVFFLIVAVLKLLQKVLQRRKSGEPPAEHPHRPPREAPPDGREGESMRRPPGRAPVPGPPATRAAPRAAHLADLQGIARGERADLSRREAEPAARAAAPPAGRPLLVARDLPPRDRLRQAVLWAEVLRRPRPVLPPPRR